MPGDAFEGQTLVAGRYRLLGEIARGTTATLYRAEDTVLGRVVALKAIAPALARDPGIVERFTAEARTAARIEHPNVVAVYDTGLMQDGRPFISMRLVDGLSLDEFLRSNPGLSPYEQIELLEPIADALDAIHAAGLVHRDVKPANILVDSAGEPYLADFGIAVDVTTATAAGITAGTPRYMSPEQVQGLQLSAAADVYSLAVVAYELLTGDLPFGGTGQALLHQVINDAPRSPRSLNPAIGAATESVVMQALSKHSRERFATANEFVDRLLRTLPPPVSEAAAGGEPIVAPGGNRRGISRRVLITIGGGCVAGLALLAAALLVLDGDAGGSNGPVATPTPAVAWAEITKIEASETEFIVHFRTGNYAPGFQLHFFFDTVEPLEAGEPGPGPWIVYDGASPFSGYRIGDAQGAAQMCILVANSDHSVNQGTGNCADLP